VNSCQATTAERPCISFNRTCKKRVEGVLLLDGNSSVGGDTLSLGGLPLARLQFSLRFARPSMVTAAPFLRIHGVSPRYIPTKISQKNGDEVYYLATHSISVESIDVQTVTKNVPGYMSYP